MRAYFRVMHVLSCVHVRTRPRFFFVLTYSALYFLAAIFIAFCLHVFHSFCNKNFVSYHFDHLTRFDHRNPFHGSTIWAASSCRMFRFWAKNGLILWFVFRNYRFGTVLELIRNCSRPICTRVQTKWILRLIVWVNFGPKA